jgi:actin-related protein
MGNATARGSPQLTMGNPRGHGSKSPSISFGASPDLAPGVSEDSVNLGNSSQSGTTGGRDPIVLDTGSYTTRIGYASYLKCYDEYPTMVIAEKMPPRVPQKMFRFDFEGAAYPFQKQEVVDWEAMEEVWTHCFDRCTLISMSNRTSRDVLTPVPLVGGVTFKEKTAQLMFEKYNVDNLAMEDSAHMALYGTGKSTGIIVDLGHDSSYVAIVVEGEIMSYRILDYGGKNISDYLGRLLQERKITTKEPLQQVDIYMIKEERSFVVMNFEEEMKDPNLSKINFVYPSTGLLDIVPEHSPSSGTPFPISIEVNDEPLDLQKERFQSPEIIFQPSLIGSSAMPLGQAINEELTSFKQTIPSSRHNDVMQLYRSISVTGGSSLFPRICDRVQREVSRLAPGDAFVQIGQASGMESRRLGTWYGAALYANKVGDEVRYISKQEYDEVGFSIFNRRSTLERKV